MKCEICKHWQPREVEPAWGDCKRVSHHDDFAPPTGDERAYTWDREIYDSGLTTRSDFGCILHELKPIGGQG